MLFTLSLLLNLSLSLLLVYVLQGVGKSDARQAHREKMVLLQSNADLLDRLMHMEGKTWTPPPRPSIETVEETPEEPGWREV